jgi:hypothetical protein
MGILRLLDRLTTPTNKKKQKNIHKYKYASAVQCSAEW